MSKRISFYILTIILLLLSCVYGILISQKHIFPYSVLKIFYPSKSNDTTAWSIGIYAGTSPFHLSNPKGVKNPVLTVNNVNDVEAKFVADPFIIKDDSLFYMFFEVLNKKSNQGDIGLAESLDGFKWKYENIVIDEPFHLSYPYVFKWKGDYFLLPESHQDLSIRLYKAINFPYKWKFIGNLLQGYHFADPQIIKYNNYWWLFVCTNENDNLNIYYSKNLLGKWTHHPMSPVIKNNPHIVRGGGRIIEYNGELYRFAQDCYPGYGIQVFAFKILKLTATSYKEKILDNNPIIKASGFGWNKYGMHTVDPIYLGNSNWLSAVDGY